MTIFIEHLIKKGYCKWEKGKIIVAPDCPQNALEELKGINAAWRENYPDLEEIVIFPKP